MTTASVIQPTTPSQTLSFEHALIRAASAYEGHVDHGRLTKAVAIARAGGITWNDDGTATVQGRTQTHHVNSSCDCDDAKFNGQYCKHSMAVELAKMAYNSLTAHQPPPPTEQPTPWAYSQAPSSCTMKWEVGGIELMLTLRDSSDQQLFTRIGDILPRLKATVAAERQQRRDAARTRQADEAAAPATTTEGTAATPRQEPEPDDGAHFCVQHDVPFKRHSKGNHVWYSHWDDEAETWCRERR